MGERRSGRCPKMYYVAKVNKRSKCVILSIFEAIDNLKSIVRPSSVLLGRCPGFYILQ